MDRKGTVLVIDDEKEITHCVSTILNRNTKKVLTADNGQTGLEILEGNEEIDCIICDFHMPILSGLDLLKTIRKRRIKIPFIFYTIFSNQELMAETLKYGTFDFIKKPYLKNLEETVMRAIEMSTSLKNDEEESDHDTHLSFRDNYLKKFKNFLKKR